MPGPGGITPGEASVAQWGVERSCPWPSSLCLPCGPTWACLNRSIWGGVVLVEMKPSQLEPRLSGDYPASQLHCTLAFRIV